MLEVEAKQRGLAVPQVLPSEKKKLYEKAKRLANMYAWIVKNNMCIPAKDFEAEKDYIKLKSLLAANEKTDKWFYENLVLFSYDVLSSAFEPQE